MGVDSVYCARQPLVEYRINPPIWKKNPYEGSFVSEKQKKVAPTEGATLHQPELAVLNEVNMEELVES